MRRVWIHMVVATLALAAAAHVWLAGEAPEARAGELELLACKAATLELVEVNGPTKDVRVRFEDAGKAVWIEVTAAKVGAVAPPGGVTPTETRDFAAGGQISRLVEALAPVKATRALGKVADDKLGELGLAGAANDGGAVNAASAAGKDAKPAAVAEGQLTIRCGGAALELELGGAAYGGGGRYARDRRSGEVYLLAEGWVGDAKMADLRFVQRELHAFAAADIEHAVVSNPAGSKTFVHKGRGVAGADAWVDASDEAKRLEMRGNWVASVLRLRVLESLGKAATPGAELQPPATPTPLVKVAWSGDKAGTLEIARAGDGPSATYYARSEATRGWVTLPRATAERVCDDVPVLLGQAAAPVDRRPAAAVTPPGAATATGMPGGQSPVFGAAPTVGGH